MGFFFSMLLFLAGSVILIAGYFKFVNHLKHRLNHVLSVTLSSALYLLITIGILVGAVFPVWLGEVFSLFQDSKDMLYLSGLITLLISALIASKLVGRNSYNPSSNTK